MNMGEKIRTIRKEKRIKQKDLASSVGLTVSGLQKIEYGEILPKRITVHKIAKVLGVTPSQIDSRFVVADSLQYFSTEDLLEEIKRRCYQMNNK